MELEFSETGRGRYLYTRFLRIDLEWRMHADFLCPTHPKDMDNGRTIGAHPPEPAQSKIKYGLPGTEQYSVTTSQERHADLCLKDKLCLYCLKRVVETNTSLMSTTIQVRCALSMEQKTTPKHHPLKKGNSRDCKSCGRKISPLQLHCS